jgi:hypothetical protein
MIVIYISSRLIVAQGEEVLPYIRPEDRILTESAHFLGILDK